VNLGTRLDWGALALQLELAYAAAKAAPAQSAGVFGGAMLAIQW
jgi:hypothetical protein